ncbi:MAG TPA: glycosyltransferase [Epsilonproteobacteria bacterium]|nr:glycosyltransferase [Campylobacterota bacterium]
MKIISLIISVYNEESNIQKLIDEIWLHVPQNFEYELIFVNDGSSDKTENTIELLAQRDTRIKLLNFTTNYGHEIAMSAGMDFSRGDAIIFMDGDLQHPPSLLPELIQRWENGSRIVLTKRSDNEEKSFFYNILSLIYYKTLNYLSEYDMETNTPDFRLIDRYYVEILKKYKENSRLFRGLLYIINAKKDTTTVEFIAPKRYSGESKYNYIKLSNLAIDSILAFSIKPLRIALLFSVTIFIFSLFLGFYFFLEWLFYGNEAPGFMTLMLTITILGSANLFVLSVIGEYVGRIHIESKNRPLYTIKNMVNFHE